MIGRLFLVDLAGSESAAKTGCVGERLDEAKSINKSLSALGNVIKALAAKETHVPYRDSKLTLMLQESLGGNAMTALIVACSMAGDNAAETLSTLRFAARAKKVQNRPKQNLERSPKKLMRLLAEAEEKIKRQADVLNYLSRRLSAALCDQKHKAMLDEFLKKLETNDVKGLYSLLQIGYIEEQKKEEFPVPATVTANSTSGLGAENAYLRGRLDKGKQALITLQIELVETKRQLESLREEKTELEAELRARTEQVRGAEEERLHKVAELELGAESVAFAYQKRGREIDQLCVALGRVLFDEDLDRLCGATKSRQRAMFAESVKNAAETARRIQATMAADEATVIAQVLGRGTSSGSKAKSVPAAEISPERLPTCESEAAATVCEDVPQTSTSILSTNEAGPETLVRQQHQTIDELTEENRALREQLGRLSTESKRQTKELIRAMEIAGERREKELAKVKSKARVQLEERDERIRQLGSEAEKMKAYLDKLLATHAEKARVAVLERQIETLIDECTMQRQELSQKEREAEEVHEIVRKLEQESRKWATLIATRVAKPVRGGQPVREKDERYARNLRKFEMMLDTPTPRRTQQHEGCKTARVAAVNC